MEPATKAGLPVVPVDPASPIPRYYQVERDLRRLLDEERLQPGAVLPAEQDLCRRYGVSRHTMRMALARLAAEDLITRQAGRGTFVRPRTDRSKFYLDRSFTRQMADMGRTARSEVLRCTTRVPLAFRHGLDGPALYLVRLRYGDDEPIGLQHTVIHTRRCPGLDQHDFAAGSLYQVLADAYRLAITEIQHTVGAAVADAPQAARLQVAPGDPLLVVHTVAFAEAGQPIEHTTTYYRADRYEYSTTHTLDQAG
jgi:GntR family transcriptional regulator